MIYSPFPPYYLSSQPFLLILIIYHRNHSLPLLSSHRNYCPPYPYHPFINAKKVIISGVITYYNIRKGMSSKDRKTAKKTKKPSQINYEDQEQQNFDKLHLTTNQDSQYHALLKNNNQANFKQNAYFFNHQRYNSSKKQEEEEKVQEQPQVQSEKQDVHNYLGQALREFKQHKKVKSRLLKEDIRLIEEEDEQFESLRKKQKTSNEAIEQSIELKSQLELYKDLVELRYNKQNELQHLKKFPNKNYPASQQLSQAHTSLESGLFLNLNSFIQLYDQYSSKVFGTQNIEDYAERWNKQTVKGQNSQKTVLDIQSIYRRFTEQNSGLMQECEKQMIKWSQRTALSRVSSSQYSSLIMQTPIGQAKKIVEQWERTSSKCQQKRSSFRVLFEKEEDIKNSTNHQIFDDFELFNELQKIYLTQIEDEQDFRIHDTLNYLKNRDNRRQKAKEVDRKASKNRKLRFNVHAKLLNFIPSRTANLIEARDQIVDNIFNCNAGSSGRRQEGEMIDM